jgi:hypothetical protein
MLADEIKELRSILVENEPIHNISLSDIFDPFLLTHKELVVYLAIASL